MTTMREVLTRFDCLRPSRGSYSYEKGIRSYTPGEKMTAIGYGTKDTQEFVSNNLDVELDFCFIMYPIGIFAFKNRKVYKGVSMYLCRETPYGVKNNVEHFSQQYMLKKYIINFVGELKGHAEKGGIKWEETSSEDFSAFMLLTAMEGN